MNTKTRWTLNAIFFFVVILSYSCNPHHSDQSKQENPDDLSSLTLENPEKGKGEKSLGEVIVYVDKYIWKNKSFSSFEDLEKSLLEEQTKKSKNKYNIYLVPKGPDEIENLAELMDFCMENDINGILIPPNKQDQ